MKKGAVVAVSHVWQWTLDTKCDIYKYNQLSAQHFGKELSTKSFSCRGWQWHYIIIKLRIIYYCANKLTIYTIQASFQSITLFFCSISVLFSSFDPYQPLNCSLHVAINIIQKEPPHLTIANMLLKPYSSLKSSHPPKLSP
ncbi:hypothetical protein FGO68_gene5600 [Halteria grandinella]|uniref:Uncharacterized protein n=1 Tax=Halteria grandinella TaxID=5974 RepID=A0A8J8NHK8_HALGN|nr:hypothetical protein FGO68_gene5600 [Halteria grandinella]